MPTNVSNWLTRRGAGALFNLQRTPYVVGTDAITANPKKTQANQVHAHTRQYLTNWPASSVVKISGTGLTINGLELETTKKVKLGSAYGDHVDPDQLWLDIANSVVNGVTAFSRGAPIIWPYYFGGSDYSLYDTAEWIVNVHYQQDTDGDGVPEDYYEVYKINVTSTPASDGNEAYMDYPCTTQYLPMETSPSTGAYQTYTTSQFPDVTIYANFGTNKLYALDLIDVAPANTSSGTSFCARHPDDNAHGLSSYVIKQGNVPYIQSSGTNPDVSIIGSYRHTSTDSPGPYCMEADCECKFFYTPDACDDCWYAGKTVTIDITYKQIQFTDNGGIDDGGVLGKSVTKGSATTHSTVTKTLTLPTGLTRQQVGSTFTVPTLAGYAVVIDDIKLVSVS